MDLAPDLVSRCVEVIVNSNHSVLPEADIAVRAPSNVIVFFIALVVLAACLVVHHPLLVLVRGILGLPLF